MLWCMRQGCSSCRVSLVTLALSVALSWSSAHAFGLAGAAVGSCDRGSMSDCTLSLLAAPRAVHRGSGPATEGLAHARLLILFAAFAAAIAWARSTAYFAASGALVRVIVGRRAPRDSLRRHGGLVASAGRLHSPHTAATSRAEVGGSVCEGTSLRADADPNPPSRRKLSARSAPPTITRTSAPLAAK